MEGVDPSRVMVLFNAVDLSRIPARSAALPPRPNRALAFTKTHRQIPLLSEACARCGIEFTTLGRGTEQLTADPEKELVNYDLIFATARSAIEALCAGSAVIVCDGRGLAGIVTTGNFDDLRNLNFGRRSLVREVTVDAVVREIERYHSGDATAVCKQAREVADLERAMDVLEQTYQQCIAEAKMVPLELSEQSKLALLRFIHRWLPSGDVRWPWQHERIHLVSKCDELDRTCAHLRATHQELLSKYGSLLSKYGSLTASYSEINTAHRELLAEYSRLATSRDELSASRDKLQGELDQFDLKLRNVLHSRSWRITSPLRMVVEKARGLADNLASHTRDR